jgi:hypothetical protein
LDELDVSFVFDPNWSVPEEDQRKWYRTHNVRKEFQAQKEPAGPFIGSVSHKAAAYRGLVLEGTEDPTQSKVDVKAVLKEWLGMTRVEAKSETRKSFQKHCQGAVDEHIVNDNDVAMAIVPESVLEQEPYAAPVARHILRRQTVLLRSMMEAQPAGGTSDEPPVGSSGAQSAAAASPSVAERQ